ncbi:thiol-disulfide isomerase/thioredoxin [Nonlabens dokdonensis]|jgi:peroxiredoxin|uniref:Thiol-disulfide isomerase/thioredoxin n=2 Tax=Nonlabens dokdonensis TaxID=328515 RepID=A0ABX5PU56_9FLAO|nr:TlpA disulfide reductase family protein [Nonlabens dokdonensis]AGC76986.1 putative thiol:disulfide interchange protein [Nonlabens dokdonensis DSW-6]PZX36889.1 thiol-disulfide isomerase/thioredoxin [Nonlabens dokdonensis]
MKKLIFLTAFLSFAFAKAQTELPELTLRNIKGKKISVQELSKDKPVVISFWATWCTPCMRELDAINEHYEDKQEEFGFEVVAIATDDARTKQRVKTESMGRSWPYEILLDTKNVLIRSLGNPQIPLTLIVKNNKIVYRHSSFTPGAELELFEEFKKHLD